MGMGRVLGPVFGNEWLTTSRRWQVYAGRSLFVSVLLVGLWSAWVSRTAGQGVPTIEILASVGQGFFKAIVFTQMTLTLLVAPAATAGAICQDRSSGKLAQLLTTDLSDSEIVLGKLAARLVPVLGLVCCALPALALSVLLGGVDPLALAGIFVVTVSLAVFGCTLALAFSVWATKSYEVLMATYGVFGIWLLAIPIWDFLGEQWGIPTSPDWAITLNPFLLAFAPYMQPGKVGATGFLPFFAGLLTLSAVLAAIAIKRMRGVTVDREGHAAVAKPENPRSRKRIGWASRRGWHAFDRSPSLDHSPVLWYETRRRRDSPWVRMMLRVYLAIALVFSALAILEITQTYFAVNVPYWVGRLPAYVVAFQVVIGLPVLLLAAATAIVEARAQGSLDILLATPLSTRRIVLTKWWGAFRESTRLLVLPAIVALAVAWLTGAWQQLGWLGLYFFAAAAVWTSIGLAISTWVSRLGRAIALAVALYAIVALAWPILAMTVFQGHGMGLATLSPYYGCFYLTLGSYHPDLFGELFLWILFSIGCQFVVAAGLLIGTLVTFNRCLGRVGG
jgi:ABC-type transport system involved in multi-copper enzyme maturation permease subunit